MTFSLQLKKVWRESVNDDLLDPSRPDLWENLSPNGRRGGKGKGGSYWEVLGPPGRRLPCQRAPRRQIKHLHLPNICKQCTVQFNFLLARLKRSFIQRISAGPLKLKHHWHIPGENNQGKCWIKIFRTPLSSSDFSRKIPHGHHDIPIRSQSVDLSRIIFCFLSRKLSWQIFAWWWSAFLLDLILKKSLSMGSDCTGYKIDHQISWSLIPCQNPLGSENITVPQSLCLFILTAKGLDCPSVLLSPIPWLRLLFFCPPTLFSFSLILGPAPPPPLHPFKRLSNPRLLPLDDSHS